MKNIFLFSTLAFFYINAFAQIPASWNTTGIGGGGSLFAPSINPANSNEFYVSCDMSELFHTTDFGLSYNIVDFRQLQSFHNSNVRFTNNPNIRYSINYANNQILPVKSSDGGINWSTLTGNPDASEETYSIWADYNNSNRVIISYYSYIYFSNDGGNTFTNIHTALDNGAGIVIGGVFFDGNNIYIGTNDGIIESVNGGSNFNTLTTTGLPTNERIFSFAAGKQGGVIRFFCVTGDVNNLYAGQLGSDYWGFLKGVYSMDNNSGTWTSKMTGINTSSDYLMFVGMAENDISTAYLGGSTSSQTPNVMKTTDGGLSWTHVFNTTNNQNIITGWAGSGGDHQWSWGECLFGLAVSATDKNYVIFTDYSNPTKTSDGGATWAQAYVSPADQNPAGANTPTKHYYHSVGLENTTSWFLHWSDSNNIFAAYTDIFAIRSQNGCQSWAFDYTVPVATNTTYHIVKNISSSTIYAATSSVHDMYKSYRLQDNIIDAGTGMVIFSTDNGATWTTLHNFGKPVYWLATDPNNSNRMYAAVINYGGGLGGIWITNNLNLGTSSTWTQLSAPPRTERHPATMTVLNNGNLLCSYSGRRNASGAFTTSSGVFLYDPLTSTWSDKSDSRQYYWCHDVVVDPNDATQNTWYSCVYSGWGGNGNGFGGLYKTTNSGTSWTKILDNADVSSCTFNPANANELFVTTHGSGLWYSANINAATPVFNQAGNYDFGVPERVFFNPFDQSKIWISSFGHGLQWGDMNATGINESYLKEKIINVYPNPFTEKTTIEFLNDGNKNITINLYNSFGQLVRVSENVTNNKFVLERKNLPQGLYFLQVRYDNKTIKTEKLVIE